MDDYSVIFIIANKYFRGYPSYLKYYLHNIQQFYNNSFTLIVDNNSTYIDDIHNELKDYTNFKIITNNSNSKFELGAYKVGIQYIIDNNLIDKYDYCIFTQDTFVLKNKYNFKKNNIIAAALFNNLMDYGHFESVQIILKNINLFQYFDKSYMCPMNSFVLHISKINDFLYYTKDIYTIKKYDSQCTERIIGVILYVLNNFNNSSIDGLSSVDYELWHVNIYDKNDKYFFIKRIFAKDENCTDII